MQVGIAMDEGFPRERKAIRRSQIRFLLLYGVIALGAPVNFVGQTSPRAIAPSVPGHRLDADKVNRSVIGMQYSNFFIDGEKSWETAEAVPVLGKYSSKDPDILKKHFQWFQQLGVDWLLIDWTNILWSGRPWDKQAGIAPEIEQSVAIMFKTALSLEKQGKYAPKMVFELAVKESSQKPHQIEQLNEVINWINKKYLDNPEYRNLWLYYDGKPLLTVFFIAKDPCGQLPVDLSKASLNASRWTVRWMSAQLQTNHAEQCGMWSWMDGTIEQKVTKRDQKAEETVVTPASFAEGGWLGADAIGRDHGTPYLDSWRVAFQNRPKFIQIHQWNEFAGQAEEGAKFYGDEFNLKFSDDIEPTQPKACTRRGCGGWGYYYLNLTRSLLSLYNGDTPDITVMALSTPSETHIVKQDYLELQWSVLGKQPRSYSVLLDSHLIAAHVTGTRYRLDLTHVSPGIHRAKLIASGARTYFDLDPQKFTTRSTLPLQVASELEFTK